MEGDLNGIIQLIAEYTGQVEKYETISTYYSAICQGMIWATMLCITWLLVQRQKTSAHELYNKAIAALCSAAAS